MAGRYFYHSHLGVRAISCTVPFAPRKERITSGLTFDICHMELVQVEIKKRKRNSELQIEESNRKM
jgi:hypothetical protein